MRLRTRLAISALVLAALIGNLVWVWKWRMNSPVKEIAEALSTPWYAAVTFGFFTVIGIPLIVAVMKYRPPPSPVIRFYLDTSDLKKDVYPIVGATRHLDGTVNTCWSSIGITSRGYFHNDGGRRTSIESVVIDLVRPRASGLYKQVVSKGNGFDIQENFSSQFVDPTKIQLDRDERTTKYGVAAWVTLREHHKKAGGLEAHRIRISVKAKEGQTTSEFIDPDWNLIWRQAQYQLSSMKREATEIAEQSRPGSNAP